MDKLSLEGKKGIILGVRTKRSIAWAITNALNEAGAELVLTYEREEMLESMEKLTKELKGISLLKCDVTVTDDLVDVFNKVKNMWGSLDFVIHSIAYAPPESLQNPFSKVTVEQFSLANQISSYSLIPLVNHAAPLMSERGGSVIALSYLGGERIVKNYNLMGVSKAALECAARYLADEFGGAQIRVNTVSAGPIRTPAARGIPEFNRLYDDIKNRAPLRRNTDAAEVADTVLFLCSDLSRGITAENIHVDSGFHATGS